MSVVLRAAIYLAPGAVMGLLAAVLWRTARGDGGFTATPDARPEPRWARRYLHVATGMIGLAAVGLALLGVALIRIVARLPE